jgi:hypothetical protein
MADFWRVQPANLLYASIVVYLDAEAISGENHSQFVDSQRAIALLPRLLLLTIAGTAGAWRYKNGIRGIENAECLSEKYPFRARSCPFEDAQWESTIENRWSKYDDQSREVRQTRTVSKTRRMNEWSMKEYLFGMDLSSRHSRFSIIFTYSFSAIRWRPRTTERRVSKKEDTSRRKIFERCSRNLNAHSDIALTCRFLCLSSSRDFFLLRCSLRPRLTSSFFLRYSLSFSSYSGNRRLPSFSSFLFIHIYLYIQ